MGRPNLQISEGTLHHLEDMSKITTIHRTRAIWSVSHNEQMTNAFDRLTPWAA